MNFPDDYFASMEPRMQKAFAAMNELEHGAIANPDEKRMVGHYWLRNPALAPQPAIRQEIEGALQAVKDFARQVHAGAIRGARGPFKNLLVIGIGGSALGPQFVANALSQPGHGQNGAFISSITPTRTAWTRCWPAWTAQLGETLCVVISKSGGTQETRNGMLEAGAAYQRAGLGFRPSCRGCHRGGQRFGQVRGGQPLAGAVSDVGLGWRADQRDIGCGPVADGVARVRY